MNKEKDFFKTCFNIVAGLEVRNESQTIAKEVVLNEIECLEQENKQLKEVIDKAIKLIKYHERYRDNTNCCQFVDIVSEILDPLQSILEQDKTTNNAYLKEFEYWLKEVSK